MGTTASGPIFAVTSIDLERSDSPQTIAVDHSQVELPINGQIPIAVFGTYADGSVVNLSQSTQTSYSSQNPSVATVSAYGVVTGIAPGSTQIIVDGSITVGVIVDPPIALIPTQATLTASQTLSFTALVNGLPSSAVTWSLSPGLGTVNTNGVYTAPLAVGTQEIDILTATSVANNTQTASATITLLSTASVSILPAWSVLYPAEPQQFTAITSNAGTSGVIWSISPSGVGAISGTGLYTAPASISSTQAVTITATSAANPTISGSTTIYISPQPFSILLQFPTLPIGQGTSIGMSVTELATDGFAHPVTFSVAGLPSGVTASFNPATLDGGGGLGQTTLTFTASTNAVQGNYNLTVTGQDTVYAALSQSQLLTLTVGPGYSLTVNSPTMTTVPGGSVAVNVTESVTGGFSIPILLEVIVPNGITASFPAVQQAVDQITGPGSAALLLTTAPSLAAGSYPITISGQVSTLGETSSVGMTLVVDPITGPSVMSMSPNPGTQTTQILTFTFTDPSGGASITTAGVLVNASQNTAAACYVQYTPGTQTLSLGNDAGSGWVGSVMIGTYGELSNSQCVLDTGSSQASVSGNTLTLTLVLTPVVPTVGTQNVYATVSDASSTSGWLQLGLWTISPNSLPSPWRDQDIGAPGAETGYSTYAPTTGTFTVNGSGSDTNAPPDQFHYTYQPLVGNGTIVAQLTTVGNIFQYTKAGVMIRASTNASDAFVFLNVQPNNGGCNVGVRTTAGAVATYTPCTSNLPLSTNPQYYNLPAGWLQITRQGNTFSFQISPDGVTWTSVSAPVTLTMPTNVLAGLAVVSDGDISSATFIDVGVTPASATASPTFNPPAGSYDSSQTVELSTTTSGALIRYTLNGSTPTTTTGALYSGPITISSTTTVNAIAYINGLTNSSIASANYAITGPPASIVATAGNPQSAGEDEAFTTALLATVTDSGGHPVNNASVTFTAPSTGASAAFSGSLTATVPTNSSGVATAPILTANATAGSYAVTASVPGVATSASFNLTNTQPPWIVQSPVISGSGPFYNFSVTANDPNGANSIQALDMGFYSTVGGTTKCIVEYVPSTAAFYLVDVGDTAGPLSLGSALSIHNTSCVLTQPTVSVSGNLETMNFLITFKSGFASNNDVLAFVQDNNGLNSGWKGIGTFTVSFVNQPPTITSVNPPSGHGLIQRHVGNHVGD